MEKEEEEVEMVVLNKKVATTTSHHQEATPDKCKLAILHNAQHTQEKHQILVPPRKWQDNRHRYIETIQVCSEKVFHRCTCRLFRSRTDLPLPSQQMSELHAAKDREAHH